MVAVRDSKHPDGPRLASRLSAGRRSPARWRPACSAPP